MGAAHLLGLWAFAIAQPVYDILRRNTDFFVAHRTQPIDLALFTAVVSFGLPLLLLLPYALVAAAWPRAGRPMLTGLVGLLAAALTSQVLAHRAPLPTPVHFAVACVVGAIVAWGYASRSGVRTFMTMLSPSAVVFPAILLLHPSMSMFVRADTRVANAAAVINGPAPPIVFLVFDQLPLGSLMDARGQIDRDQYPSFAALADQATWYRNASTVAELTGWAMPPIVSGLRPTSARGPTSKSYPHNLFTWLGGRYRLEVQEPITQLCPDYLCDANRDPWPARLASMTLDSSVVYLNVALPASLRAHLPPLTENWKDFIHARHWQRRWVLERDDDRRRVPRDLVASISRDDPQPTLYFTHTLLPHEPYVYLRSGQEFTKNRRLVGLTQNGLWTTDDWAVTVAYHRHLQQVEYADTVLGQVMDRLKTEGLFDAALIVVTSDHGASFTPGRPFKGVNGATLPDIMSVPLFVKAPRQRQGAIDDSNIESVDIMPTIAALLNVPLTWTPQGRAAGAGRVDEATKTIRHGGALQETTVEAAVLARARDAAVARKVALFGEQPGWRAAASRRRDLIGRRVDDLAATQGPWQAVINDSATVFAVDPAGPVLPTFMSGRVFDARGTPVDADVAIAVNGVITGVARTYRPEDSPRGTWAVLADPSLFTKGHTDVRVFVLPPDGDQLHLAYSSRKRPEYLNLAAHGAGEHWGVMQSGFYTREGEPFPYRWTNGEGALVVPLEPERPPKSLRVGLTAIRAGGTPLTVTVNDCTLFSGTIDAAPWYRTFSLGACPASALSTPHARILLKSPSWQDDRQRTRGVAVEAVNLLRDEWPIAPAPALAARASITVMNAKTSPLVAGTSLSFVVANVGSSTWLSAADDPNKAQPVQIVLRWRRARSDGPTAEQRLDLPRAVYPTDRLLMSAPLVPPDALRNTGPWRVTIATVQHDGTPLPLDDTPVVDVTSAGQSPS